MKSRQKKRRGSSRGSEDPLACLIAAHTPVRKVFKSFAPIQICSTRVHMSTRSLKKIIMLVLSWWYDVYAHRQNDTAALWVGYGCPKHKLVIGVPFYGRTYELASQDMSYIGAPIERDSLGGRPGPFTGTQGIMSYLEVKMYCKRQSMRERSETGAKTRLAGIKILDPVIPSWIYAAQRSSKIFVH